MAVSETVNDPLVEITRFSAFSRLLIEWLPLEKLTVTSPATSMVTSSVAPGKTSPLQLAASPQFVVAAPPSQETALKSVRSSILSTASLMFRL